MLCERTPESPTQESSSAFVRAGYRVFGLPIVDSLLPDGVPVPCSVLISAEPGSGRDIISTAIIEEHLSSSLSVPFQQQKVLWLSLDNLVEDLRNSVEYDRHADPPQIQFIDCYSGQIGIESTERYQVDPSNLPHLSMVASTAITEMNSGGRLLIILDSLTSLIQKVGLRRSTEFFKMLTGKARAISADLLTTLNRKAFTAATIATFADIADLVLELTVQDNESPSGQLRVPKARSVRHFMGWRTYKIDLERRTFQYDLLPSPGAEEGEASTTISPPKELFDNTTNTDFVHNGKPASSRKPTPTSWCEGPYCTFGGRAIMERERLAIYSEVMNAVGKKYQDYLRAVARTITNPNRGDELPSAELLRSVSEQIERMDRLFALVKSQNKIHPSIRPVSIDSVIHRALTDSTIPSNVAVIREPNASNDIQIDPALIARSMNAVFEAAFREMPAGGSISIKDYDEGDSAVVIVKSNGFGNWNGDLSALFEPGCVWDPLAGLGLIVARKFVEAHGGKLTIESEREKGTTFTIRLPMRLDYDSF